MSENNYEFSDKDLKSFKANMIGEKTKIIFFFVGNEDEVVNLCKY